MQPPSPRMKAPPPPLPSLFGFNLQSGQQRHHAAQYAVSPSPVSPPSSLFGSSSAVPPATPVRKESLDMPPLESLSTFQGIFPPANQQQQPPSLLQPGVGHGHGSEGHQHPPRAASSANPTAGSTSPRGGGGGGGGGHQQQQQQPFPQPLSASAAAGGGYPGTTSYNRTRAEGLSGSSAGAGAATTGGATLTPVVVDDQELRHWVTLFGFPPDLTPVVLRMFAGCGTITAQSVPQGPANYLHVRFASVYQAGRALEANGRRADGCLIVGVLPCQDVTAVSRNAVPRAEPTAAAATNYPALPHPPNRPMTDDGIAEYKREQERPRKRARQGNDTWNQVLNWAGKLADVFVY